MDIEKRFTYYMFSKGIQELPLQNAIANDDQDIMIIATPYIAFKLCNMMTEEQVLDDVSKEEHSKYSFKISQVITAGDVFRCANFDAKQKAFNNIFPDRMERFFDTKKADYLYFDGEEQTFLHKIFKEYIMNCAVEIFIMNMDHFERVEDIADLKPELANEILNLMDKLKIRVFRHVRSDYALRLQARSAGKMGVSTVDQYIKKYPRLDKIKNQKDMTKDKFKSFKRHILQKFHPDTMETGDKKIFQEISEDMEIIENSSWYKKLPEKPRKEE